jgi:hypothetical protein
MFASEEESRVALYTRRVLIQRNCSSVLPPFLRFVRGVIDCADIPLSISRCHTFIFLLPHFGSLPRDKTAQGAHAGQRAHFAHQDGDDQQDHTLARR